MRPKRKIPRPPPAGCFAKRVGAAGFSLITHHSSLENMGKQRSLSNEEKTRIFAQHDHILIPSSEARKLRDVCVCADEAAEAANAMLKGYPGASMRDARARINALVSSLDRVDYQYLLSVPGEYPADVCE